MEFKTIEEKVNYLVKNAHSVKEKDYYKVLDSIEYTENKVKFAKEYNKKYEDWIIKNIPEAKNYIKNNYINGNPDNVYYLYKIASAKILSKDKLMEFKEKKDYEVIEMSGLYNGIKGANNNLYILNSQQVNREDIYVYKNKDVSLIKAFKNIFKKVSYKEDDKVKLYIVVIKNKYLPSSLDSEHEKIYNRAKKLSIPKDLIYSYGNQSTFEFLNENMSNLFNITVGDWKLNRDDFENSKFVIKENKRRGEVSMFDDSKERIMNKIRNKDYKYLENNTKIYYLGKYGNIISDNSKVRLLCLLYMLEDKNML